MNVASAAAPSAVEERGSDYPTRVRAYRRTAGSKQVHWVEFGGVAVVTPGGKVDERRSAQPYTTAVGRWVERDGGNIPVAVSFHEKTPRPAVGDFPSGSRRRTVRPRP